MGWDDGEGCMALSGYIHHHYHHCLFFFCYCFPLSSSNAFLLFYYYYTRAFMGLGLGLGRATEWNGMGSGSGSGKWRILRQVVLMQINSIEAWKGRGNTEMSVSLCACVQTMRKVEEG
jgi:hypothetical protein